MGEPELPKMTGLPGNVVHLPILPSLVERQLAQASVLNLADGPLVDDACARLLASMAIQS